VATGTGFLIDAEGRIVTNAHVVEGARQVQIRLSENELVDAQVVGTDVSDDLALLKVDPARVERVRPLPLGDSDAVRPGDAVAALGNPLGLQDTITAGIVSAKQRTLTAPNGFTINDVIQTDAAVNPGNSGGPLLDQDGRVIGINSQIATAPNAQGGASTSEGFIGIAFAIPVNTAKEVIRDLEDDGRVDKPYLGVNTVTLTQGLAQQLGIDAEQGALVVSVAEGGPAAAAGLRGASPADTGALTAGGDVIVRFGDRQITSSDDLGSAIADTEPGQTIALRVLRDGRERTVRIRLATRPTTTG
jgi:S1-C subfamily serine protease